MKYLWVRSKVKNEIDIVKEDGGWYYFAGLEMPFHKNDFDIITRIEEPEGWDESKEPTHEEQMKIIERILGKKAMYRIGGSGSACPSCKSNGCFGSVTHYLNKKDSNGKEDRDNPTVICGWCGYVGDTKGTPENDVTEETQRIQGILNDNWVQKGRNER